jgi:hypothetical protein
MYVQLSKCSVYLIELADIAAIARRDDDYSLWTVTNGSPVAMCETPRDWFLNRLGST